MILRGCGPCYSRQRVTVVPGHPLRRTRLEFRGMPEQLCQIVKRVGFVQFTGVDQTHKEIAHPRPVHRFIEECVFAMQNRLLQRSFGDVVVCVLLRRTVFPGASPGRLTLVPAGST